MKRMSSLPQATKYCVYIFATNKPNRFKIGKTRDRQARVRNAATWNPELSDFDVIYTKTENDAIKCETYLHNKLQSKRFSGDFFDVEQTELKLLIQHARDYYLADFRQKKMEVELLEREHSDGRMLMPDKEARSLFHELLKMREQYYEIKNKKEHLENQLCLLIGTASGFTGLIKWETEERTVFDTEAFRLAYPDLYERFHAKKTQNRAFRIIKKRTRLAEEDDLD